MNLDLHVHTVFSIDSPVQPEQYAERMLELKQTNHVHGMVFMEHKLFECGYDYEGLARDTGLLIFHGTEADTIYGHMLCYGMTLELFREFNLDARCRDLQGLITALYESGGVAVPAHPFRSYMGMGMWLGQLDKVKLLEALNGGSTEEENQSAMTAARRLGWGSIGGSDAHFVAELGGFMTAFQAEISSMEDLCRELRAGRCRAISLDQASRD